jgi:archaellum component FlaC
MVSGLHGRQVFFPHQYKKSPMFEKDPRTFSPEYKNLSPEQKAMVKLEITLTNFFKNFDKSLSRWERMIYPMLVIVGILGLSGFYLIYNVTTDMHTLTEQVDPRMEEHLQSMSTNMQQLSQNIAIMTEQITFLVGRVDSMEQHITSMDGNIGVMAEDVGGLKKSIGQMSVNIADMNHAVRTMTVNTGVMSRDINQMGRPMDFMNSFTPW